MPDLQVAVEARPEVRVSNDLPHRLVVPGVPGERRGSGVLRPGRRPGHEEGAAPIVRRREARERGDGARGVSIVPSDARTALVKAGLDTVGAFMAKDPNELGAALSTGES